MFCSTSKLEQSVFKSAGKLLHVDAGQLTRGMIQRLVCVVLTCSYNADVNTVGITKLSVRERKVDNVSRDVGFLLQGIQESWNECRSQPSVNQRQILAFCMIQDQSNPIFDLANVFQLEPPRAAGTGCSLAPFGRTRSAKLGPALPNRKAWPRRLLRLH